MPSVAKGCCKVGGGYICIHRLLLEHFASLSEEDIQRLASTFRQIG